MKITARLAALAATTALVIGGTTTGASAIQTPSPDCFDLTDCRQVIDRLTNEGDNLRSDVDRLQYGVDGANHELRVLRDNVAGRDRDLAAAAAELADRTSQRDSWITFGRAQEAKVAALTGETNRLQARNTRLTQRAERLVARNARLQARNDRLAATNARLRALLAAATR